jgi:putative solute:sodium symporter small subunit
MKNNSEHAEYWRANLKLIVLCLAVWFLVSFACGILFVEQLNQFRLGGFKLGFWFAQQGSIFSFLLLIIFYIWQMARLDKKYHVQEEDPAQNERKSQNKSTETKEGE